MATAGEHGEPTTLSGGTLWFWFVQFAAAALQLLLFVRLSYFPVLLLLPLPVLLPAYMLLAIEAFRQRLRVPARSDSTCSEPDRLVICRVASTESTESTKSTSMRRAPSGRSAKVVLGASSARAMLFVDVKRVQHMLVGSSAAEVLTALATTETLHVKLDSDEAEFALVSYRQRRVPGDDHTLDEEALRSVVHEATVAGVPNLWLDAWCFRLAPGAEYDHAEFCTLLATVARRAGLVIWLPRSRTRAPPDGSCASHAHLLTGRLLKSYLDQRLLALGPCLVVS